MYGFADDHIANKRFRPNCINSESLAIKDLEDCAVKINNWMNLNKLKMNNSKTEFIMFGSKAQLNKCSTNVINVAGENIKPVSTIRYLGAFKRKCHAAMLIYLRIKRIRHYLTKDATEILTLSLVISHLDYCNVILYGIADSELSKMQRIQNMCAKLVLNRRKYDSSREALYDLHWLPVKARINFKLLSFMYNCFVGDAPVYLTELLSK